VLQAARTFDRKPRAYKSEDQQQQTEDQHFHGYRIRDWRLRILWLNVERVQ
jgi:hypothetical protein